MNDEQDERSDGEENVETAGYESPPEEAAAQSEGEEMEEGELIYTVQFHPEDAQSPDGPSYMRAFFDLARNQHAAKAGPWRWRAKRNEPALYGAAGGVVRCILLQYPHQRVCARALPGVRR